MREFKNLHQLSSETDNAYSFKQLREVLRQVDVPLSSPYPFRNIEEVQTLDDDFESPLENRVISVFDEIGGSSKPDKDSQEINALMLLERLEHDEHALNWVAHAQFTDSYVAGNDSNLIDLVLRMPTHQKLAMICALSPFDEFTLVSMRYDRHLPEALLFICNYAAQPRCGTIDFLPVNFDLSAYATTLLNAHTGQPGSSSVLLNASPVNTLPKALLLRIAKRGNLGKLSSKAIEAAKRFSLPTEICHEMAYFLLLAYVSYDSTSEEFRSSIIRDSEGVLEFEDIFTTEWNLEYPVLNAEFSDCDKLYRILPGNSQLDPVDLKAMVATFSKFISYGVIGGLSDDLVAQLMIDNKGFFSQTYESPGKSLLHNFSHSDGTYGREQVDAYIDTYQEIITGSYVSRYKSCAAHVAEMGERLLAYLSKLHSPVESSKDLYHHALAKILVLSLHHGKEHGVFDLKELTLSQFMKGSGITTSLTPKDDTLYDLQLLKRALLALPPQMLTLDIKLCCGIRLSKQDLERASEGQAERSFMLDMSL
jgi:hypothetical protein